MQKICAFSCSACRCPSEVMCKMRAKNKIFLNCVIVAHFGATFKAFRGMGEREDFERANRNKLEKMKT